MGAREKKTLISTRALGHHYFFFILHLLKISLHFPSLEHMWFWCFQYIFWAESLKAQTFKVFSLLATTIGDPLHHGHDLDLSGHLLFYLLAIVINDPLGCDPFGCGHDLDRHIPSFLSLLQLLVIFLIMVMILVFVVLLFSLSWLQLLVIFLVVIFLVVVTILIVVFFLNMLPSSLVDSNVSLKWK